MEHSYLVVRTNFSIEVPRSAEIIVPSFWESGFIALAFQAVPKPAFLRLPLANRDSAQFQHFVENLQESFWGEVYGKTRLAWKQFLEKTRLEVV